MSKIAIMILAHNNEDQIQRLVNHLSKDFDVFVHIDKRVNINIFEKENVYVYSEYKSYWGSYNQILATLFLLRKAFEKHCDRYILISGLDLPLKTNKEIKTFFKDNNNEYLEIVKLPRIDKHPRVTAGSLSRYYLNYKHRGLNKNKILFRIIGKILYILGNFFPRKIEYELYGGANWSNYTNNCVEKIFEYLKNDEKYLKRYRWTRCADEIFFQTIIHQLQGLNIVNNTLRYIDHDGGAGTGGPKVFRKEDYETLITSNALFGRKFDETIDNEIIDKIYKALE